MEDVVRALPEASVQETSFEDDATAEHDDNPPCQRPPQQATHPGAAAPSPSGDSSRLQYGSISRQDTQSRNRRGHGPSKLTTSPACPATARALAPDLLRGLLMVLMAMGHNTWFLNPWEHDAAINGEPDSGDHRRNGQVAYITRLLTHPGEAGLTFLLAMGIVYFGRSRRALGWSAARMARHFLARALVLTLICVPLGLVLTLGRVWFINTVLFALAVDYLLAGLLWLLISRTEESLAFGLLRVLPDANKDDASEPLLADRRGEEDIAPDRKIIRASDISWHLHNVILLALAVVTIWWNLWLSSTGPHCKLPKPTHGPATATNLPRSNWFRVWFYPLRAGGFVSAYPPLGWVSFAMLGLLYGRIVLARPWTKAVLAVGNLLAALPFLLVFVLTRVLQLGNLSEDRLHVTEHEANPDANPYLSSWKSFFYLVKYPPDIAFWSYGIGFNILLLAFFSAVPAMVAMTVLNPLLVYGQSALFFYITHLVLLFATSLVWLPRSGREKGWTDPQTGDPVVGIDSLWIYWLNWALVLAVIYPLCRWYGSFKRSKGPESLWRFF